MELSFSKLALNQNKSVDENETEGKSQPNINDYNKPNGAWNMSKHFDAKLGLIFTDVTDYLIQSTDALSPGTVILAPNFSLWDAMAASQVTGYYPSEPLYNLKLKRIPEHDL
jgi:hypothetical protein